VTEPVFDRSKSAGPWPVPAGGAVGILVETRDWEICACNDTGYDTSTSFVWIINSAEVRVRP